MEFRELFLTLFRKFDERKQPRSFLRDLVETTHLFLKMLEKFCKGRNNVIVQVFCSPFYIFPILMGKCLLGNAPILVHSLRQLLATVASVMPIASYTVAVLKRLENQDLYW